MTYIMRCWRSADAVRYREAVDASLGQLRPFINWAQTEPATLEETACRLAQHERDFSSGERWRFAIVEAQTNRVVGGATIHKRVGPHGRDFGYWLRTGETGKGIMTAAIAALAARAFRSAEIDFVEIRCDAANDRSAAVARRLGFETRETSQQSCIFRLEREQYPTPQMRALCNLPAIEIED